MSLIRVRTVTPWLATVVLLVVLGSGCSRSPRIEGAVLDIAGAPLAEVTIKVLTTADSTMSRPDGRYRMDLQPGQWTLEFSRPGYATHTLQYDLGEGAKVRAENVVLYPLPNEDGAFALIAGKLEPLAWKRLEIRGTLLGCVYGIPAAPEQEIASPGKFLIYRSRELAKKARELESASTEERAALASLGMSTTALDEMEVCRLKFEKNRQFQGLMGKQSMKVGMWIADTALTTTARWLDPATGSVLVILQDEWKPGTYAFHTGNLRREEPWAEGKQLIAAFSVAQAPSGSEEAASK